MNADEPTPRVGFAQLKNMIGRRVLFVGRVESQDVGRAHMAAPDGSKVVIEGASSAFETQFAEVQGVVVDPTTIREESHVDFGENFDMNTYNELLRLANGPHQQMFYQ
ncbi:hypothetical protein MNEG_5011 [Monoraphidium neglectum]|uniref:Replication factor A protein 3 n=1 Tax=Monoraphidium neglectum TaxID=145388 RepID=A0A0D2L7V8_9CHLO|nr:hypothetical protein MNEG_5011 [Monoraphidium neglectum]KIZ02944.1 hypothetical protein MNEG_5011 [Monoraphidium neglectum]|eukprot:XP_013901963.1 hypothetical protein MNEG_5011 [Monoraphidium neglectum]